MDQEDEDTCSNDSLSDDDDDELCSYFSKFSHTHNTANEKEQLINQIGESKISEHLQDSGKEEHADVLDSTDKSSCSQVSIQTDLPDKEGPDNVQIDLTFFVNKDEGNVDKAKDGVAHSVASGTHHELGSGSNISNHGIQKKPSIDTSPMSIPATCPHPAVHDGDPNEPDSNMMESYYVSDNVIGSNAFQFKFVRRNNKLERVIYFDEHSNDEHSKEVPDIDVKNSDDQMLFDSTSTNAGDNLTGGTNGSYGDMPPDGLVQAYAYHSSANNSAQETSNISDAVEKMPWDTQTYNNYFSRECSNSGSESAFGIDGLGDLDPEGIECDALSEPETNDQHGSEKDDSNHEKNNSSTGKVIRESEPPVDEVVTGTVKLVNFLDDTGMVQNAFVYDIKTERQVNSEMSAYSDYISDMNRLWKNFKPFGSNRNSCNNVESKADSWSDTISNAVTEAPVTDFNDSSVANTIDNVLDENSVHAEEYPVNSEEEKNESLNDDNFVNTHEIVDNDDADNSISDVVCNVGTDDVDPGNDTSDFDDEAEGTEEEDSELIGYFMKAKTEINQSPIKDIDTKSNSAGQSVCCQTTDEDFDHFENALDKNTNKHDLYPQSDIVLDKIAKKQDGDPITQKHDEHQISVPSDAPVSSQTLGQNRQTSSSGKSACNVIQLKARCHLKKSSMVPSTYEEQYLQKMYMLKLAEANLIQKEMERLRKKRQIEVHKRENSVKSVRSKQRLDSQHVGGKAKAVGVAMRLKKGNMQKTGKVITADKRRQIQEQMREEHGLDKSTMSNRTEDETSKSNIKEHQEIQAPTMSESCSQGSMQQKRTFKQSKKKTIDQKTTKPQKLDKCSKKMDSNAQSKTVTESSTGSVTDKLNRSMKACKKKKDALDEDDQLNFPVSENGAGEYGKSKALVYAHKKTENEIEAMTSTKILSTTSNLNTTQTKQGTACVDIRSISGSTKRKFSTKIVKSSPYKSEESIINFAKVENDTLKSSAIASSNGNSNVIPDSKESTQLSMHSDDKSVGMQLPVIVPSENTNLNSDDDNSSVNKQCSRVIPCDNSLKMNVNSGTSDEKNVWYERSLNSNLLSPNKVKCANISHSNLDIKEETNITVHSVETQRNSNATIMPIKNKCSQLNSENDWSSLPSKFSLKTTTEVGTCTPKDFISFEDSSSEIGQELKSLKVKRATKKQIKVEKQCVQIKEAKETDSLPNLKRKRCRPKKFSDGYSCFSGDSVASPTSPNVEKKRVSPRKNVKSEDGHWKMDIDESVSPSVRSVSHRSPCPEVKRKRGRPRKYLQSGNACSAVGTSAKSKVKRKRGRPKKSETLENLTKMRKLHEHIDQLSQLITSVPNPSRSDNNESNQIGSQSLSSCAGTTGELSCEKHERDQQYTPKSDNSNINTYNKNESVINQVPSGMNSSACQKMTKELSGQISNLNENLDKAGSSESYARIQELEKENEMYTSKDSLQKKSESTAIVTKRKRGRPKKVQLVSQSNFSVTDPKLGLDKKQMSEKSHGNNSRNNTEKVSKRGRKKNVLKDSKDGRRKAPKYKGKLKTVLEKSDKSWKDKLQEDIFSISSDEDRLTRRPINVKKMIQKILSQETNARTHQELWKRKQKHYNKHMLKNAPSDKCRQSRTTDSEEGWQSDTSALSSFPGIRLRTNDQDDAIQRDFRLKHQVDSGFCDTVHERSERGHDPSCYISSVSTVSSNINQENQTCNAFESQKHPGVSFMDSSEAEAVDDSVEVYTATKYVELYDSPKKGFAYSGDLSAAVQRNLSSDSISGVDRHVEAASQLMSLSVSPSRNILSPDKVQSLLERGGHVASHVKFYPLSPARK